MKPKLEAQGFKRKTLEIPQEKASRKKLRRKSRHLYLQEIWEEDTRIEGRGADALLILYAVEFGELRKEHTIFPREPTL